MSRQDGRVGTFASSSYKPDVMNSLARGHITTLTHAILESVFSQVRVKNASPLFVNQDLLERMDFQPLKGCDASAAAVRGGVFSMHSGGTPPGKVPSHASSWKESIHPFAHANFSSVRFVKPPSPAQHAQPTFIDSHQQLSVPGCVTSGTRYNLTRQEYAKFGVENYKNCYQANNVRMMTEHHYADFGPNVLATTNHMMSAKRGTTPVAEDLIGGISMIRPMTKPATPIVVRSTLNESCEVNWASDLLDTETNAIESLQNVPTPSVKPAKITKKAFMKLPKASKRVQGRRGKFQVDRKEGQVQRLFELSDILSNLPATRKAQNANVADSDDPGSNAHKLAQARIRGGDLLPQKDQSSLPARSSHRVTRLQRKTVKRSQKSSPRGSISSSSLGRNPVRLSTGNSRHHHQIIKMRRSQVKYQQNRQRHHLQLLASSRPKQKRANEIGSQQVNHLQSQAFEVQQECCAASDGLWEMEKDHIYSSRGNPISISPDHNNNNIPTLRSANRTPPSRLGGQPLLHPSWNGSVGMIGSVVRTVSRGASSSAERELYTIFSGLTVIKMQQQQTQVVVAAATTFEGQGSLDQQSVRKGYLDRPYRWLPAKTPTSHGPARVSSV